MECAKGFMVHGKLESFRTIAAVSGSSGGAGASFKCNGKFHALTYFHTSKNGMSPCYLGRLFQLAFWTVGINRRPGPSSEFRWKSFASRFRASSSLS